MPSGCKDITGEVNFVKSSADRYDEKAKEKKSLIAARTKLRQICLHKKSEKLNSAPPPEVYTGLLFRSRSKDRHWALQGSAKQRFNKSPPRSEAKRVAAPAQARYRRYARRPRVTSQDESLTLQTPDLATGSAEACQCTT